MTAPSATPPPGGTDGRGDGPARRVIVPASIDETFDRPGSVRSLAILRIVLGPAVLVHLAPFLSMTAAGENFTDHFWEPWFTFLPRPGGAIQAPLVWIGAGAALAMTVGWRTRFSATTTAVCVTGNMFLSQTYFRHNRAFLIFLLWAVALGASGRVLSLDARRARRAGRPVDDTDTLWPLWTIRYLAASVYLASGLSKAIDPDWIGGLVLWDRAVRYQHLVAERLPGAAGDVMVDVITTRWVHAITSPIAVGMELFIGLGLWFARTRLAAVWVAAFFHVSIEISASVEVFSFAAIVALVIWATPTTRDRRLSGAIPASIAPLDWLARFERCPSEGPLLVVDRDGRVVEGVEARWLVASRLPLTFPVAGPGLAIVRRRLGSEALGLGADPGTFPGTHERPD